VRKFAALAVVVGAALMLAAMSFAAARGAGWSAKLTAKQEVPKQAVKAPAAHGAFTATLKGTKLTWKLTFAKLSGPATAAHIHMGAMGVAGGVKVALCGPCKSGQKGTATVPASVIKAFGKHLLYVNVHTAKNPAGEIRGQLGG
jgi:CHRD domain-containing protein